MIEQDLQKWLDQSLERIYENYGYDTTEWRWEVKVVPRCRAPRLSGIKGMQLNSDLQLGKKNCPMKKIEKRRLKIPHPADNIVGPLAAERFPERCELCGLKPCSGDFQET